MNNQNLLEQIEEYVRKLFKEKFHPDHIYHNITHTADVVKAASKIAKSEDLSEKDTETLLIAAWFHDIGYLDSFDDHEERSCEIAQVYLNKIDFAKERIDKIKAAIRSTKVPQSPKDHISEILCDADLKHLGSDDFFERSDLFRVEMERRTGNTLSDYEWLKSNIDFTTQHKFFTRYAREKYLPLKEVNLVKLQKQFRKKLKKYEEDAVKDEKLAFEKEKLAKKREEEKKADRGVETMFRNVMRTHIDLSSMADNKANIMISVNTLLLGAIATLLARKLDANPHLVIPTIVLSVVSLATLIYAILATRPSITSGTFTREDIENKKTNLLFFGNFYNMELKDFNWGMNEMMNDRDYLYGSMIKDFYFLGQVLGRKYKLLRICYSIFMYGMVISIILFIVFILMYPAGSADFGPLIE